MNEHSSMQLVVNRMLIAGYYGSKLTSAPVRIQHSSDLLKILYINHLLSVESMSVLDKYVLMSFEKLVNVSTDKYRLIIFYSIQQDQIFSQIILVKKNTNTLRGRKSLCYCLV